MLPCIARLTVQPVSADEFATEEFNAELVKLLQGSCLLMRNILGIEPPLTLFDLDKCEWELLEPFEPAACMPEADDYNAKV